MTRTEIKRVLRQSDKPLTAFEVCRVLGAKASVDQSVIKGLLLTMLGTSEVVVDNSVSAGGFNNRRYDAYRLPVYSATGVKVNQITPFQPDMQPLPAHLIPTIRRPQRVAHGVRVNNPRPMEHFIVGPSR